MNIFQLSDSPILSAQLLHDKHVVKMTLETAQLLSQAVRMRPDWIKLFGGPVAVNEQLYRSTHVHHPSAKWARENGNNFDWLVQHGIALADEYNLRFGRRHRSKDVILACQDFCRHSLDLCGEPRRTKIPQCMPEKYKTNDPVLAYRMYYLGEKVKPDSKWTERRASLPEWLFEKAVCV